MPSRVIRGEINASRSLSRVSLEADLTFRALVVSVDDYGRMEADPLLLKAALYPRREAVKPAKVREWVEELADEGCLQFYTVDDVEYLVLAGWEKHRGNTRRMEPKHPAPPNGYDPAAELIRCVYFLSDAGRIKIGWTGNLWSRMQALQASRPSSELLGIVKGAERADEKRLHRQFAQYLSDGEWFANTPEIRSWVAANCVHAVGRAGPGRAGPSLPGQLRAAGLGVGEGVGEGVGVSEEASSPQGITEHERPPAALRHKRLKNLLAPFGYDPPPQPDEREAWWEANAERLEAEAESKLPDSATPKQVAAKVRGLMLGWWQQYLGGQRTFRAHAERLARDAVLAAAQDKLNGSRIGHDGMTDGERAGLHRPMHGAT